jgi:hypothetical protein
VLLSDALKCRAPDQRDEQRLRLGAPITEREEEGNRAPAGYDRIHDLKDSRGFAGAERHSDYELTKGLDSRRSRKVKRFR